MYFKKENKEGEHGLWFNFSNVILQIWTLMYNVDRFNLLGWQSRSTSLSWHLLFGIDFDRGRYILWSEVCTKHQLCILL